HQTCQDTTDTTETIKNNIFMFYSSSITFDRFNSVCNECIDVAAFFFKFNSKFTQINFSRTDVLYFHQCFKNWESINYRKFNVQYTSTAVCFQNLNHRTVN